MALGTVWSFKTKHFQVIVDYDYDEDSQPTDWDETGETAAKIASGEWAQYVFRARVIERATGNVLATDYLGDSIYENPEDFRDHVGARGKHGSYFTDMVREVINGAREEYANERPKLREPR